MIKLKKSKIPTESLVLEPSDVFTKVYKRLSLATYWVDTKGNWYAVPKGLSDVYSQCRDQYLSFCDRGKLFYKTNEQIAIDSSWSESQVRNNIKPFLKEMNLLKGTHGNQQYLSLDQLIGTIHNTTYKCKEDLPYLDQKSYIETKSTWTEEQKSVWLLNQKEKRKMKAYLSLLDQNPLTTEAYIPVKQETRIPFRLQTQEEKEYD